MEHPGMSGFDAEVDRDEVAFATRDEGDIFNQKEEVVLVDTSESKVLDFAALHEQGLKDRASFDRWLSGKAGIPDAESLFPGSGQGSLPFGPLLREGLKLAEQAPDEPI